MRAASAFCLVALMKPASKERRSRRYSSPNNVRNEARVREAWQAMGDPRLPPGPFRVVIFGFWPRSAGHYLTDGVSLSSSGRKATPGGLQDWDNVGKLVCDALNDYAWKDDRYCTDGRVVKQFDETARIVLYAWSLAEGMPPHGLPSQESEIAAERRGYVRWID